MRNLLTMSPMLRRMLNTGCRGRKMKDVPLPGQNIRKRVTDVVCEALFGIGEADVDERVREGAGGAPRHSSKGISID